MFSIDELFAKADKYNSYINYSERCIFLKFDYDSLYCRNSTLSEIILVDF